MSDIPKIAIDPYLLCLPDPCFDSVDIENFVSRIVAWSEALQHKGLDVLVSEQCCQALFEDGQYPYEHRLRDLLKRFAVDFADHNTICVAVRDLIERTDRIEKTLGIRYVLHESRTPKIEPDLFLLRLPDNTRSAFLDMLLSLSAYRSNLAEKNIEASIASSFTGNSEISHYELRVEGTVDDIEWMDANYISSLKLPCSIEEMFLVFDGYDTFRCHVGKWALWDGAKSDQGARDAIEAAIDELVDAGINVDHRNEYLLGPCFIDSLQTWGFGSRRDYAMVLIESCARIVLGNPKNTISEFWMDSNARTQRQRADGALAYRTHLTRKGAGYRLMFWRRQDNTIEFANVGDKDELLIL